MIVIVSVVQETGGGHEQTVSTSRCFGKMSGEATETDLFQAVMGAYNIVAKHAKDLGIIK